MGNGNSSNSKVDRQVSRVGSFEGGYDYEPRMGMPIAKFREEYIGKGTLKGQRGTKVYSDNTPLDNDETFTTFIRHSKYKIGTVSRISREQSNAEPTTPPHNHANARDNQNDQFSNFIHHARNKLRTTSSKRRNGSFKTA